MPCKGIKRFYYALGVVLHAIRLQGSHMRLGLLLMLLGAATSWAGEAFGVWKLNQARSTPGGDQKSLTLRIEPHTQGEVFTLDIVAKDGRASTISTILYFDGKARDFQDSACSGTQSSRRVDTRTVEIMRTCTTGAWMRFFLRLTAGREIVLEVSARQPDGRPVEQRLVLEKQ
jgi:hypothetical protein